MALRWTRREFNNTLDGEGFYISYNYEETALVFEKHHQPFLFLVLEGDFREQYEKAIEKGKGACCKVYRKYRQFKSWKSEEKTRKPRQERKNGIPSQEEIEELIDREETMDAEIEEEENSCKKVNDWDY